MIKWKILDICCFRFVFNKGVKGPGWDVAVPFWSLALSLTCQRWDSFSRFDVYSLHNQTGPGEEWGFSHLPDTMTVMQINAVTETSCDPGAHPSPGCWEHPCKAKALLLRLGCRFSQPRGVGAMGTAAPLLLTAILCDLSGSKLQPLLFCVSFCFDIFFPSCLTITDSFIPRSRVIQPYCHIP